SSTDGRSSSEQPALRERMSAVPDPEAQFPDSGEVAGQTVLDLPRGTTADPDPGSPEWNARSYPAVAPGYAAPPSTPARGVAQGPATIPTHAAPPPATPVRGVPEQP